MQETERLTAIASAFCIEGEILDISETGRGHINDTYLVTTSMRKYILQRINTEVFKDPKALMNNVVAVTEHLGGRLSYIPHHENPGTYQSYYYPDQSHYYGEISGDTEPENDQAEHTAASEFWRMMTNIDNSYSCETVDDPEIFCEIGRAYGAFISDLSDFPAENLNETIEGFHDTRKRFNDLVQTLASGGIDSNGFQGDPLGHLDSTQQSKCKEVYDTEIRNNNKQKEIRIMNAREEICFALEHESDVDILGEMARRGELPIRVTHNDTKINNVMLDRYTNRAACVIDLDTIMPGLAVNDFGDAIRSGASTGREDERDISNVRLDLEMYRSFARGFIEGMPEMTERERQMLPYGAKIMTLECGIRFLTDYLHGDRYFKTDYPDHNLVRCRAQFSLVRDMEENWEQMQAVHFGR